MSLDILFHLFVYGLLAIEVDEGSEKPVQVVTIIEVFIELLKLIKNLNEISHNVREDSNTKEKDERTSESFDVASWAEVSKSYS